MLGMMRGIDSKFKTVRQGLPTKQTRYLTQPSSPDASQEEMTP